MMYSDYYAISSTAFSVLFIPFIILSSFSFCRALQALGYSTRQYMRWLGCTFWVTVAPTILLSALAVMAQITLRSYLRNTYFDELAIIIGYAAWLLLASICLGLGFARYAKSVGGLFENVPRIADRRIAVTFTVTALAAACVTLILNLYGWRPYMYILPLMAPFLVPFVNIFMPPAPRGAVIELRTSFAEESR